MAKKKRSTRRSAGTRLDLGETSVEFKLDKRQIAAIQACLQKGTLRVMPRRVSVSRLPGRISVDAYAWD